MRLVLPEAHKDRTTLSELCNLRTPWTQKQKIEGTLVLEKLLRTLSWIDASRTSG